MWRLGVREHVEQRGSELSQILIADPDITVMVEESTFGLCEKTRACRTRLVLEEYGRNSDTGLGTISCLGGRAEKDLLLKSIHLEVKSFTTQKTCDRTVGGR